jgi:hypothetical protein
MYDTLAGQFSTFDSRGRGTLTTDPARLTSLVESILDFNLPDDQTANMLRRFGISQARAEELLKQSNSGGSAGSSGGYNAGNMPTPEQIMRDTLGL